MCNHGLGLGIYGLNTTKKLSGPMLRTQPITKQQHINYKKCLNYKYKDKGAAYKYIIANQSQSSVINCYTVPL